MTGMWTSKFKPVLGFLLLGTPAEMARADRLLMANQARLTGEVRSISEKGMVELASPLSTIPLKLKAESVDKVEFSVPEVGWETSETLIELTNGDVLPAIIEGLDETHLRVTTAAAGSMAIPRAVLSSMQLGVRRRKVIYSGPKDLADWTNSDEMAKNWSFANNSLVASGSARASHAFDLPESFILKFKLKWQSTPNFQIYFADPLNAKGGRVDRYALQFDSNGIVVRREAAAGKQTVIMVSRGPDQFPNNQLDVELRVDRKASRIHLFLNGEPEASGVDPVPAKPTGGGVSITSNSAMGSNQEISAIELMDYDNSRTRHLAEERGDPKTDSLISREDERWGGHLTGIRKTENGNIFTFKSDFQEEPLEISQADISTLFFSNADRASVPPAQVNPFTLRLRGDGSLHLTSCTFTPEEVKARHPLLGDLVINRSGVAALERLKAKKEETPKEEEPE